MPLVSRLASGVSPLNEVKAFVVAIVMVPPVLDPLSGAAVVVQPASARAATATPAPAVRARARRVFSDTLPPVQGLTGTPHCRDSGGPWIPKP